MRRDIKKSFWVNSEEDRDIKAKSQAAGLTEAEFIRQRVDRKSTRLNSSHAR